MTKKPKNQIEKSEIDLPALDLAIVKKDMISLKKEISQFISETDAIPEEIIYEYQLAIAAVDSLMETIGSTKKMEQLEIKAQARAHADLLFITSVVMSLSDSDEEDEEGDFDDEDDEEEDELDLDNFMILYNEKNQDKGIPQIKVIEKFKSPATTKAPSKTKSPATAKAPPKTKSLSTTKAPVKAKKK